MKKMVKAALALCLLALWSAPALHASDFDDGISKPHEDSIERDDELGQKDRNVSFIKRNAMSKADVAQKAATTGGSKGVQAGRDTTSSGNMNSVVLGVGGTVRGDIVIIDQSRGERNQVIGR